MFYIDLDLELYAPGGEEFLREIASFCRIDKKTRVLEVGASAAFCSRFLAKNYGCQAVATDINPAWLPVIEKKAKRDGVENLVKARREDVLALSSTKATFDLALANGVLYFTDKQGGLKEMVRVVVGGGRVILGEPLWLKKPPFRLKRVLEWGGEARIEDLEKYHQLFGELGLKAVGEKIYDFSLWENYYQPAWEKIESWKNSGSPFFTRYGTEIDTLLEEMELVRQFGKGVVGYALLIGEKP